MPQPPTAMMKLDMLGIDAFCDAIIDGKSHAAIASELGMSDSAISRWLASDAERSARARQALIESAMTEDNKAERVLLGHVKDADGKPLDPATKRELAFHYRWRSRVRNPRDYGDKVQVDNTHQIINLSDEEILKRSARIEAELQEAGRLLGPPVGDGGEPS